MIIRNIALLSLKRFLILLHLLCLVIIDDIQWLLARTLLMILWLRWIVLRLWWFEVINNWFGLLFFLLFVYLTIESFLLWNICLSMSEFAHWRTLLNFSVITIMIFITILISIKVSILYNLILIPFLLLSLLILQKAIHVIDSLKIIFLWCFMDS